jgi:hypothetical protein
LRALLTGPARWFGLVSLGAESEGTPPRVFRPRPRPAHDPAAEPPALAVKPDLTLAMPAARRFQRFQLARVADLAQVGDPYIYRLTPASLQRAVSQHIDVDKVLSFLGGLTDAPLPEPVRSSLTRWAERGTEIWLEQTLLLHVEDAAVMEQLTAAPKVARYLTPLNTTAALVNEKDWARLVATLAELGLLPELVNIAEV